MMAKEHSEIRVYELSKDPFRKLQLHSPIPEKNNVCAHT